MNTDAIMFYTLNPWMRVLKKTLEIQMNQLLGFQKGGYNNFTKHLDISSRMCNV